MAAKAPPRGLVNVLNVPRIIATVVSSRLATLTELDTVYGVEDAWVLMEIAQVEAHNEARHMNKA